MGCSNQSVSYHVIMLVLNKIVTKTGGHVPSNILAPAAAQAFAIAQP
jgi:hypothetical protein